MGDTKLIHVALFSLLACGACGLSSDGEDDPPATPDPGLVAPAAATARGELAAPRTLQVSERSGAEVTARRLWGDDLVETATLAIHGGELTVRALPDGRLAVDELTVVLGDVRLSAASVPPAGLELTGISVRLRPLTIAARWSDDAVAAAADVELLLDWSLASQPGQLLAMATQHIAPVPMTVEIARAPGGRLVATLRAARPGVFFTWSGLLELGDLVLTVDAS